MTYPAATALEGFDTLTLALRNFTPRATAFLQAGMLEAAYDTFNLSQYYCPHATGFLRSSGRVDPLTVQGNNVEVSISYSAPYALFVHERLDIAHRSPTRAKFLETAFNETNGDLGARMKDRIEGALVGAYPGSPAQGQHNDMQEEMKTGYGHKSGAEVARAIRSATPMSMSEIDAALHHLRTSVGSRVWKRS